MNYKMSVGYYSSTTNPDGTLCNHITHIPQANAQQNHEQKASKFPAHIGEAIFINAHCGAFLKENQLIGTGHQAPKPYCRCIKPPVNINSTHKIRADYINNNFSIVPTLT